MESFASTLPVLLAGLFGLGLGLRAPTPHRLSLLCVSGALILGPLAHLSSQEVIQVAGAGVAIGFAVVAGINTASVLIRRGIQPLHRDPDSVEKHSLSQAAHRYR